MKVGFLDKLIERLDRVDPQSLQSHFLHLNREKGLLEAVFHAVQEGILLLDKAGRVQYANRAAQELLGVPLATMMRRPIAQYLREIDWSRILELDSGEWSKLLTYEIEVNYPEHRFLSFYVVPLPAEDGATPGVLVMLRDVTKVRADEENMRESERFSALRLLAAGVAHEIGNPLNSLHIHLQLLGRELDRLPAASRDRTKGLIEVAEREVARLDLIISQFLRAVRPSKPELAPTQLPGLLDETLTFLKQEITDRGIFVEVVQGEAIPDVRVDPAQVKQAFFNVIRNALQAMPNGGALRILLAGTDQEVSIAFVDSGPGIPADKIGRIFEPYYTTKSEGSGLGLMIVQRIVHDHGGRIEVHSAPGAGTTFTIVFPRHERQIRLLKGRR